MPTHTLEQIIDDAFEHRSELRLGHVPRDLADALERVFLDLNAGVLRVCEKIDGAWVTHQWLKKAVLLSFRTQDNRVVESGAFTYYDKVPGRFEGYSDARFREGGFRVVPGAVVRNGSFIARNS